ncbi:variable large family protein [Borrelia coriaceae]|uniref:variable large family protein n=1 Tax=Borrelia coriaceae TaxID=144 RepID=UPI0004B1444E|nr:variable large family protein [Borrelia coriaceae]
MIVLKFYLFIPLLQERNTFLSSLANLGNDFLSVFISFGDMMTESLGFKSGAKKADVATYFKKVQDTLENTKTALNKIVDDMKTQENPNAASVETAVKALVSEKFDKIIQGAKTVGEALKDVADEPLGNVAATSGTAAGAQGSKIENLINGIKDIVDIVLKNEGNAEAGDDKKAENTSNPRTDSAGEAGKLFGNTSGSGGISSNPEKAAVDAAKAVGASTGADILKAIIKDKGDSAKLANNTPTTTVTSITKSHDATIAGAIVLRAMAPGGKFANGTSGNDISTAVKGVAVSAVTKALDTLTIAIRKTINTGLKTVKDAITKS